MAARKKRKKRISKGLKMVLKAAGGAASLASKLPSPVGRKRTLRRQSVESWTEVPPQHVLDCERITGVSRHEQRPDIYGPPIKAEPLTPRTTAG